MNAASQWRIEFAREIAGFYATQPNVRMAALTDLIAEVLDLVEQHMPEIDTSRTRMIQRMPARPCAEEPPFPLAATDD